MRAVAIIGVPLIAALWGWLAWSFVRARQRSKRRRAISGASWRVIHDSLQDQTRVMVCLVASHPTGDLELEMQTIAMISGSDPEFNDKFLKAMADARERASVLNSER